MKERITDSFTKDSNLRVVIGTDSFGMGFNSNNVRLVIYYGVLCDVETQWKRRANLLCCTETARKLQ